MHVTVDSMINRKYLHLIRHSFHTVQLDLEIAEINQLPGIYMQKNHHSTHISVQYVIDITFAMWCTETEVLYWFYFSSARPYHNL